MAAESATITGDQGNKHYSQELDESQQQQEDETSRGDQLNGWSESYHSLLQRQTAVTAYLKSKQLLLFVFSRQYSF